MLTTATGFMVGNQVQRLVPGDEGEMPRAYHYIGNVAPAGGPSLWITRVAGMTPGANVAGCKEIMPGGYEEFFRSNGYVPEIATYAVSSDPNNPCPATVEIAS